MSRQHGVLERCDDHRDVVVPLREKTGEIPSWLYRYDRGLPALTRSRVANPLPAPISRTRVEWTNDTLRLKKLVQPRRVGRSQGRILLSPALEVHPRHRSDSRSGRPDRLSRTTVRRAHSCRSGRLRWRTGARLDEVCKVLDALDETRVRHWVAGGWGVDFLVGHQSREHRDLDLAVDAKDYEGCISALTVLGYEAETDCLPLRIEMVAPGARWVDIHPVHFDAQGLGLPRETPPATTLRTPRTLSPRARSAIDAPTAYLSPAAAVPLRVRTSSTGP